MDRQTSPWNLDIQVTVGPWWLDQQGRLFHFQTLVCGPEHISSLLIMLGGLRGALREQEAISPRASAR